MSSIALLILAYLGSYVALLDPLEVVFWDGGSHTVLRDPGYRVKGDTVRSAFAPLAWADQQFRSDYWGMHTYDNDRKPTGDDFPVAE
jgi:hypothetical protein